MALDPKQDITIKVMPSLNHYFQTCESGSPSEYAVLEETISPQVLEVVGQWLEGVFE